MSTPKQIQKTVLMISDFAEYYRMAKGVCPARISLTKMQAIHIGVTNGEEYKGMVVDVLGVHP
jgi:hypothetical protein